MKMPKQYKVPWAALAVAVLPFNLASAGSGRSTGAVLPKTVDAVCATQPEMDLDDIARHVEALKTQRLQDVPVFDVFYFRNETAELARRLSQGQDPNACGPMGMSLLGTAAMLGSLADVKLLLAHGAQLEKRNDNGRTALLEAILFNRYDVVDELLAHGANYRFEFSNGYSALHQLAESFNDSKHREDRELALAQFLLDKGISPNAKDRNPHSDSTPLMRAVVNNKPALVKLFMAHGADPRITNVRGNSAMDLAVKFKRSAMMPLLQTP